MGKTRKTKTWKISMNSCYWFRAIVQCLLVDHLFSSKTLETWVLNFFRLSYSADVWSKFFGFCSSHLTKQDLQKLMLSCPIGYQFCLIYLPAWTELSSDWQSENPTGFPMVGRLPNAPPSSNHSFLCQHWKRSGQDTGLRWPSTANNMHNSVEL